MESRQLLTNNQAGFRPNRCTTDQILKLIHDAKDQIQSKMESNRIMMAFFDYAKAYNKVWHDRLLVLERMSKMNLPMRYIGYVKCFRSNRKTCVEVINTRIRQF